MFEKVQKLKQSIYEIQRQLDGDPFNKDLKGCSVHIGREYNEAAEDELKLLHQKAKNNWLKEEDKNYNFLSKSTSMQPLNKLNEFVQTKLSQEDALVMIRMVTNEEIKAALFDIDSSKAAGLDGYNSCFFKKAWSCIGEEVSLAVQDFFLNEKMLGEINATSIALVPKLILLTKYHISGLLLVAMHIQDNILISQELLKAGSWLALQLHPSLFASMERYHYGCKELKLTHMCFADDLMVSCNGDKAYLEVVKKAIEEFSCVSGLFPNLSKSIICFGSINEDIKKELLEVLPFKHVKLPMKYLGPKNQGGLGIKPLHM
nr:hypothetical protein [Tanacetum cinerariifolium]